MGRVLVVPKEQFVQGTLKLYRGDEWTVQGAVKNLVGGIAINEDISSCSGLTAYFPGETETLAVECEILDAGCGTFQAVVADDVTPLAGLTDGPTTWYAVGDFADGRRTVATVERPLEVLDRGFQS